MSDEPIKQMDNSTIAGCVGGGDIGVRTLRCTERFRAMAYAQITYRESLRDIEACLGSQPSKLYGMGLRGPVASFEVTMGVYTIQKTSRGNNDQVLTPTRGSRRRPTTSTMLRGPASLKGRRGSCARK
jgi:hypothetical protein